MKKGRERRLQSGDAFWERQRCAPLYQALIQHAERRPHPFHVPGHKMGRSFDQEAKQQYLPLLPLDLTEISGLDDLHQPEGVIAEAQALAAEAYGAEETRFLVGGTTAGNIALILAVCRPGEKIVIQRNCHKSVYHGIILARAKPIYVVPAVDPATGVAAGLRREDVERTLQEHPDAKAVFLTNPTYYGMGIDLRRMAAVVHRFGIPLLVDEAHGSHFGFHPELPDSAMGSGADASVQSTHKMGTAMTMCSMLHLRGERINRSRLYQALGMIQSSSPSYPLLASLDLARRHMLIEGAKELDRVLPLLKRLRERLASLAWLALPQLTENGVYTTLDPLKLMLDLRTEALTGYQLQQILEQYAIFPELTSSQHVLLAASTGTSPEDVERVWQVLESIDLPPSSGGYRIRQTGGVLSSWFLREQVMAMHEALDADRFPIPLEESEGRIAGEMVIPYPPGIPLLVPGERIDQQALQWLLALKRQKIRFHGVHDPSLTTIQIVT
ncbi:aminotransferase class I/II-fold pyridoxal phosphate-dependent enzyme [Brevibacillus humidisoli]|uniref:aminotransferase class I/II-fold pyridoxal phosphate-dependent enzyme n=1 Tax=Brevibacillus humidisoli TaxID=2895522 RepID=UPI001E31F952|nr:aminotransferase class I/II-fold pyridoxal phosphate-dependent enzyme [Brevibacillus humidisoli]UFJ40515.1 aminotransferase class I/II-fold pyridoxal phosphate-dependent enzyme [Brevibacillus humidisoli]